MRIKDGHFYFSLWATAIDMHRSYRIILAGICLVVTATVIYVVFDEPQSRDEPEQVTVVLGEKGFDPQEITLQKGGTITFSTTRNKPYWPASNLHPSHTIYSEFDPMRPLQPSETWQFTFDRVGDWAYHDHLRSYYVGIVHVVE